MRRLFPHVIIAGDRPDLVQADLPCVADIFPGSALWDERGTLFANFLKFALPQFSRAERVRF
jgi:hypothetical protein